MNKIRSIIAIAACVLLAPNVHALVILTEQFANYANGRLGDSGTGGTGADGGWFTPQDQITLTNSTGNLFGTNLGLVTSFGTRVSIAPTNSFGTNVPAGSYNRFTASGTFRPDRATNIYTSFLYRFNVGTDVSTDGRPISAMNRQNSGFTSTATFSWWLLAKRVGSDIQLGLARAGGTTTNYATTNLAAGQTFFVVVRQQIIAGAGLAGSGTNDIIDLWINPPSNAFGTDEANIPTPSVSTSDGNDDTSNTGPGRLWVISSGASAEVDEMRVANSWAEATPPVGQCLTAGIVADPTNLTQSAEISATLRVVASGTSPSYKWQIMTNGGSTWNNISGATLASYTTPNLSLADSGTQYRAIVNVSCDGSSATSGVATVTLIAPTVTPVSTVMNDTFLDPDLGFDDRSNPPLTVSNSLWYTSVTDDLTAFNQGGNMLGIPAAGSSRLWLGYFTDTNQLPVHLAIGRTIKVTMPFIANSYSAFTNNAGLRFGLFDYYDGGTRFTYDTNTASGSGGNGANVRGYMLNLDFGPIFSVNSPVGLLTRIGLSDNNLMGTTGDYLSLGSGPSGGGFSNTPAFQAGQQYTLTFSVTRTAVNSVDVTATILGGLLALTHTATETNNAYHRFDSFAIRPNSLETSADSFTFSEFIVEVLQNAIQVAPFNITGVQALAPDSVKLTWNSETGASYQVLSTGSLGSPAWTTNATVLATGSSTSYTNTPVSGAQRYYRVVGLPYTP